jgi:predicted component of type VI protein secretion system
VAYEVTKVITITGVVKEFRWVNPHTWLHILVDDATGAKVEWQVEGRAPGVLLRAGWTKTSLKPGEKVTVDMSPAKDGTKVGIIARVTKEDGTILSNQPVLQ